MRNFQKVNKKASCKLHSQMILQPSPRMHQMCAEESGTRLSAPAKTPAVLLHEQKLRECQQQADDAEGRPDLGPLRLQDLCLSKSLPHTCAAALVGLHSHARTAVGLMAAAWGLLAKDSKVVRTSRLCRLPVRVFGGAPGVWP